MQEQPEPSTGRVARPPAERLDAAPKRQPTPASSAARNLQTGTNVADAAAAPVFARGTTGSTPLKADGTEAARSATTPAIAEAAGATDDSEEIDVSDQLEAVDDLDPADLDPADLDPADLDPADLDPADLDPADLDPADLDPADLDASDDLIVEEEEDEETSTSVSWGADGASGAEPPTRVAPAGEVGSGASGMEGLAVDDNALGRRPGPVSSTWANDARNTDAPRETSKPNPDRMMMPSEMKALKQTLVEAGTEFKGTLKSSCPVAVNGTIDGEIDAPTLNIASTGSILGNVKAKTLRSQGTLSGNVDADEVFLSGAVRSKTFIKTKRLEMKLGSLDKSQLEVTFGNCDLELSDV